MSDVVANAVQCVNCGRISEDVGEFSTEEEIPDCPHCGEYPIAVRIEDCVPPCDPEGGALEVDDNHHWGRYRSSSGKRGAHVVDIEW